MKMKTKSKLSGSVHEALNGMSPQYTWRMTASLPLSSTVVDFEHPIIRRRYVRRSKNPHKSG